MARPPSPRRRGDLVVQRVREVTLEELARAGLQRLSVPEVARKTGVNKTSVYRRWPTKQALVKAALKLSMEHVREVPDTGSLVNDLFELAKVVAGLITSPRGMGVLRIVFADGQSALAKALAESMWRDAGGDLPRVISRAEGSRPALPRAADAAAHPVRASIALKLTDFRKIVNRRSPAHSLFRNRPNRQRR